jgi:hypothetical protein
MSCRVILVCSALLGLAGCGNEGPVLHPVRGKVLVNGRPAERVVVAFYHSDPTVKGNAAHPCTVTNEAGEFQMSTNTDGDGAVEGEYIVTFIWWSDPDPDRAKDLLSSKYSDEKKSTFRAKVSKGATELPPFELTADPTQVKKFVK